MVPLTDGRERGKTRLLIEMSPVKEREREKRKKSLQDREKEREKEKERRTLIHPSSSALHPLPMLTMHFHWLPMAKEDTGASGKSESSIMSSK